MLHGWQFRATQLRHPELARIPTVIVTAKSPREPDRYALRADNILRKPFEDADILKAAPVCMRFPTGTGGGLDDYAAACPGGRHGRYPHREQFVLVAARRDCMRGACADGGRASLGRRTVAGASAGAGGGRICTNASTAPVTAARSTAAVVTDPAPASARRLGSKLAPAAHGAVDL